MVVQHCHLEFRLSSANVHVFNPLPFKTTPRMITRTQVAVMGLYMSCDQAKTKDGSFRYKLQFSNISNSCITKIIKNTKQNSYIMLTCG